MSVTDEEHLRSDEVIRIQVISDLHTELSARAEPASEDVATGADAVVLAGDIAHAPNSVAVAARLFPEIPLILVAGNHEHYATGLTIDEGFDAMRRAALDFSAMQCRPIHVLEDEEATVDIRGVPVRFLGSTLWTDFALFGDPVRDRAAVERGLNDFRLIRGRAINPLGLFLGGGATPLRTAEWLDRHDSSVGFLRARLTAPHDGPTVVVTHHLPSLRSVSHRYRHDPISAGFASRLDGLVGAGAALWAHGHTHDSGLWRDAAGTLVVCNPAGYARRTRSGSIGRENPAYDPRLVVALSQGGPGGAWQATALGETERLAVP